MFSEECEKLALANCGTKPAQRKIAQILKREEHPTAFSGDELLAVGAVSAIQRLFCKSDLKWHFQE